ncbi:alpha/beta fold hydrolase [Rubrolithibacter danxiaensis]|uniref:alpha/beta fold hydrolase n=1 Tax=Rubrolithibacter danxiaensis TaxID=3390805 RepID=UPI003BF86D94
MNETSGKLKIGDITLSYTATSVSDPSQTVILVHGFPFTRAMWKPQLASLTQKDIRVITYDIRGFGNSSAGHGFFSIDLFAEDLIEFITSLKLEKIILCGLSMGGYIVLRTFEKKTDLFAGLILSDTNSGSDPDGSKLNRFLSIEKIQKGEKKDFAEDFFKRVLSDQTLSTKPDLVNTVREMILSVSDSTICAAQLALASRTDTTAILKNIKIPVLIIRGEEDRLMPVEQAKFLHSQILNSRLVEIPQSAHLPNLENPDAFNAAVTEFCLTI